MRIRYFALLSCLMLSLTPGPAFALLCGTITVSASLLNFGNYTPSSAKTANTSISLSCPLGLAVLPDFTVGLTSQNAPGAAGRYLKNGASHLNYNIYTSGGYGTVWGDSVPNLQSYNSLLLLGSASFTGFGRIAAGQYVASGGPYTDIVTVTVTY